MRAFTEFIELGTDVDAAQRPDTLCVTVAPLPLFPPFPLSLPLPLLPLLPFDVSLPGLDPSSVLASLEASRAAAMFSRAAAT